MFNNPEKYTKTLVFIIVINLLISSLGVYTNIYSDSKNNDYIKVTESMEIEKQADTAIMDIEVISKSDNANDSQTNGEKLLVEIKNILLANGIKEQDIFTNSSNLTIEEDTAKNKKKEKLQIYKTTYDLRFIIRELIKQADILKILNENGIAVKSTKFELSEIDKYESDLRADIIKQSRIKANEMAYVGEEEVSGISSIIEKDHSTKINEDNIKISSTLEITYKIREIPVIRR